MKKILAGALMVVAGLFMLSAPSVMAQLPCTADFDCNQNVDADDVTEFLNQFGRNPFNDPCPDCYDSPCPCTAPGCDPPASVPKTGQTTCYDTSGTSRSCTGTGEDGEQQSGVAWPNPRFTDNADGTVTDNLTGLIWLKNANCIATNYPGYDNDQTAGDGSVTWQHALDFVGGINAGTYADCGAGNTDWRLPNSNELASLIDKRYYNPALPNTAGTGQWSAGDPFTNVQSSYYWSGTSYAYIPYYAWGVDMFYGSVIYTNKTYYNYVWPVRSDN